jgi:uncharacterized protein (DUF305 family)
MSDSIKINQTQNNKTFYVVFFLLGFLTAFLISSSFGQHKYKMMNRGSNYDKSMKGNMHTMSAKLDGKTGAELEKAFLEEMIPHHEGAIEMAEKLKNGTQKPELLDLADKIIVTQTSEIVTMKQWLDSWFSNND